MTFDPQQLADDLDALATLFAEFGPAQSPETIRIFAVHHDLKTLIALGWLRLSAGRWTTGLYTPAGELARRLSPSPLNGEKAGMRGESNTNGTEPTVRAA